LLRPGTPGYTEPDGNLASDYVLGKKGLAAVGGTKTGGIFNAEVLHGALADAIGIGEALRWWFQDTRTFRQHYGFDDVFFDGWWLGMMVQGAPLTPRPDDSGRAPKIARRGLFW